MIYRQRNQEGNGYDSVLKDYDFFHNEINNFVIIDEIPNNYNNNIIKNSNDDKNNSINIEDLNNNGKLKDFF